MADRINIDKLLKKKGLKLAGASVACEDNENVFYSFVRGTYRDKKNRDPRPSKLKEIANQIAEDENFLINFIFIDERSEKLDVDLRKFLLNNASDLIKESYLSIEENEVLILIETKKTLKKNDEIQVRELIMRLLSGSSFKSIKIYFSEIENLPPQVTILRAIHTLSPCSIADLLEALKAKGFSIPKKKWLIEQVKKIIEVGNVVESEDVRYAGHYILSLKGLSIVGTLKNKYSPDIKRGLAIARKRR